MAYTEAQKEQFCGIHAINMLFQQRKLVWFKGGPELMFEELLGPVDEANEAYISARTRLQIAEENMWPHERALSSFKETVTPIKNGKKTTYSAENTKSLKELMDSIKTARAEIRASEIAKRKAFDLLETVAEDADAEADDFTSSNVCLNMAKRCEEVAEMANMAGIYNIQLLCASEDLGLNGQFPVGILNEIIESLNYVAKDVYPNNALAEFDANFNNPNCIGVLVNFVHPRLHRHYVAIVKYTGEEGIAWADSDSDPILTPITVEGIKANISDMLSKGILNVLLFVLAKEDSATTVALERWQEAGAAAGAPVAAVAEGVAEGVAVAAAEDPVATTHSGGTRRRRKAKRSTRRNRRKSTRR